MLTRLVSNFAYGILKFFFKERNIRSQVPPTGELKSVRFKYMIVGIRPRVSQLAEALSLQSRNFEVVGFNGFTESLPLGIYDEHASMVIQGRGLSAGEVGCARSHQLSYQRFLDEDWVIFLEDDVDITGLVSGIERDLASLPSEPTLVMLEYGSTLRIRMPFWSRRALAHTYALNKSALEIINNTYSEIWCVADWPIQWIFRLNFNVIGQDVIRLNKGVESVLEASRFTEKLKMKPSQRLMKDEKAIDSTQFYKTKNPSLVSLYQLLRNKRLNHPFWTAFLASKSGLYFLSQK
jgi:GR25 family glycosyltransferase involved in LPS biosynthesis